MEDDFTLLDRFASGDEDAFEKLVSRHQKVIYYLALRIVGSHDDAAEVSQRSFTKAFGEVEKFRRLCSFRTWLCRIAINMSKKPSQARRMPRNGLSHRGRA